MSAVYIESDLKLYSIDVPHEKFVIGKATWLIAPLPAGDFCFHRYQLHDTQGYGGCFINFLMADDTIETYKGPYRIYSPNDFGTASEAESRLGIPGVLAQATKLTVGKNLGLYTKNPEIIFQEKSWKLGDWKDRVIGDWRGYEIAVTKRGSIAYPSKDDLKELFASPRLKKPKVPVKTN